MSEMRQGPDCVEPYRPEFEFYFKYEEQDPIVFKQKEIYRQQQITLLVTIY